MDGRTGSLPYQLVDHVDYTKRDSIKWTGSKLLTHSKPRSVYCHHVKQQAVAKPCLKQRKPYKCSNAQKAHILRQKHASAQRLAQYELVNGAQSKTCYVCEKVKSWSEFKRVCKKGKFQAVGPCHACKESPDKPAALARLRRSNWGFFSNWHYSWYNCA
jgi:hypothetical protein